MKSVKVLLTICLVAFIYIASGQGGTVHVCPGSGTTCNITIQQDGETKKISSEKNSDGGSVIIVFK